MKKILISVLIVLLAIMAYMVIFKGLSLGNFKVLSIQQIGTENDKLTQEIASTESLIHTTYRSKTEDLEKSISNLLIAKEEYLDLTNVSTESEIDKANQEEIYTVEFLLVKLGRYCTAEGVNLKYDFSSGTTGEKNVKNITFTVTGGYIPIMEFISDLENDSKLGFRIENFKMLPNGENRQATFTVKNVKVKMENVKDSTVKTTTENIEKDTTADDTQGQ